MRKLILHFSDKYKDYTYINKIEKEKKVHTKKILFKTKLPKNEYISDKSNPQLHLISPLVNLIDNLINFIQYLLIIYYYIFIFLNIKYKR